MPSNANTNCTITGTDLNLVTKDYLIDLYPNLVSQFKQSGLWTWGYNSNASLGDNTVISKSSPVQTVSASTIWKLVSSCAYATAAIKTDNTLWMWGDNTYGGLGDNTRINRSSPVQTVSTAATWKQVSAGSNHTSAVKTDGTLWSWGYNFYGQLGDNTVIHRSSPVQITGGGTNWQSVAAGYAITAGIKTNGTLWLWGENSRGGLGDNTVTHRSSPVQTVLQGTNWKLVATGRYHSAAIKTDSTLWTWGTNLNGELGTNDTTFRSSPVQTIDTSSTWIQVSTSQNTTKAIKTDGTLWVFGFNGLGQLGDNTRIDKSSPVQTISSGTGWKEIGSGAGFGDHSAAIKTDGTLWLWGDNTAGGLGDNTVTHRSSPVQTIYGGTNWKQVSIGRYVTVTIKDDSADIFGDPL